MGLGKRFFFASVSSVLSLFIGFSAIAAEVKIGVVQPLVGPPGIVDFGESYLQGIQLAVKEYQASKGKYKINLIVYDDEANPQRAVSLVTRLIEADKVSAVIGTTNSGNVMAFAPLLQKAQIPLMAGPSTANAITEKFINEPKSYIFRCSMVESYQIRKMIEWGAKKYKGIGMLTSTTASGIAFAKEVPEQLKALGIQLVDAETGAPNVTDLTPQMLKLKNADAKLIYFLHESYELPFRAMSKLNYHPILAGNWGLSSLKMLDILGKDLIEGTVMGQALDMGNPKAQKFDTKMRKEYGTKYRWPVVAALGYDGTRLVLKALDKAGPNPQAIRDALEQINDFEGVTGVPKKPFGPKDHEALDYKDVFLGVWKNGKVVSLKD
jgi:branched-chain amino acid transport system substrate-binding protein